MLPSRQNAGNPIFATGNWRNYVLETIVFLVAALVVDAIFFGGERFNDIRPHPFWIIVLLVSVQYGLVAGLFAAIASSCALLVGALPFREQSADFYRYAASIAGRPASWLLAATVLGGLRSMHLAKTVDLEEQLRESQTHANGVASGLDRALAEIRLLEERIARDGASQDALLADFAHAGAANTATFFDTVGKLTRQILDAREYALFHKTDTGLDPAPQTQGGWQSSRGTPQSLGHPELIRTLTVNPKVLDAQNTEDAALLPTGAKYLIPIFSARTKTLHGAIMVCDTQDNLNRDIRLRRATALGYAVGALADSLPAPSKRL